MSSIKFKKIYCAVFERRYFVSFYLNRTIYYKIFCFENMYHDNNTFKKDKKHTDKPPPLGHKVIV